MNGDAGSDATPSGAVCILGPPRSGTSLTARILNMAGVYLGAEDELRPADRWNPRGFWEHQAILELNERLLVALGGNSLRPPDRMPRGWERSERFASEREEARRLLEDVFAGRPLWGWKDPRNCLTLPFWRLLIPDIRFVVCLRNPVDVAASARRLSRPRSELFGTWRRYTAAALENTSGGARILVPYEGYVDCADETIGRLWSFVRHEEALDPDEAERLRAAVDRTLLRHRTQPEEVLREELPPEVSELYRVANEAATRESRASHSADREL